MSKTHENLLFCSLDIEAPPSTVINVFDSISYSQMKSDEYRNCYHIPIFTSDFQWTEFAHLVPELKTWLEKNIFDWCYGKIMIITTPPNMLNPLHIDCAPNELFTPQHKFRAVIQGKTSTLKFVTRYGEIDCPDTDRPFIMSGNWPHYMNNSNNKRKYTLAIGKPWLPSISDTSYRNLLDNGLAKFEADYREFKSYNALPEDYYKLFEKRYNVSKPLEQS